MSYPYNQIMPYTDFNDCINPDRIPNYFITDNKELDIIITINLIYWTYFALSCIAFILFVISLIFGFKISTLFALMAPTFFIAFFNYYFGCLYVGSSKKEYNKGVRFVGGFKKFYKAFSKENRKFVLITIKALLEIMYVRFSFENTRLHRIFTPDVVNDLKAECTKSWEDKSSKLFFTRCDCVPFFSFASCNIEHITLDHFILTTSILNDLNTKFYKTSHATILLSSDSLQDFKE